MHMPITSQERLTQFIYQSWKNGWKCPYCMKWFEPNGTGPESMPALRWLIKKLIPWDAATQRAVSIHDWRFHIGKNEYNLSFEEIGVELNKNIEEDICAYMEEHPWKSLLFGKIIYNNLDEIYEWMTTGDRGEDAFDSNGCTKAGGIK